MSGCDGPGVMPWACRSVENGSQLTRELRERLGHAGVDGALGDPQHFGDLPQLQILVMAKDDDGAKGLGEAQEGPAYERTLLVRGRNGVGTGGLLGPLEGRPEVVVGRRHAPVRTGPRMAACAAPEFVVAEVDGHAPEVGGEACGGLVLAPALEDPGEGHLGHVLADGGVTEHPGSEAHETGPPAIDEKGEGGVVVRGAHPPHELLVRRAETGGKLGEAAEPFHGVTGC